MNIKSIPLVIIILILLLISSLIAYFYFNGAKTTPEEIPIIQNQEENTTAEMKIISKEAVLKPTIINSQIKYYSADNGKVYQSNFDGSDLTMVSDIDLPGLFDILWSPDKTKVISFVSKNNLVEKYYYNYQTKTSSLLNQNIESVDWSPNSQKIAYFYDDDKEENNISVANPDGSGWQNIFKTRIADLLVKWISFNKVSFWTKPSGLVQGVLYVVSIDTGELNKIIGDTYGLSANWSPDGDKLIYSSTNERGNQLKLIFSDIDKNTQKILEISTFPEKCVWSKDNKTIFCAVPRNETGQKYLPCPADKTLPDDWYKGTFLTNDDFYKINLETNEKTLLYETGDKEYNASDLLLSDNEDYLFFVNKTDKLLMALIIR